MKAPAFTLPDQNGKPVSLEQFKGRKVVLYFYPKADTPGCTVQACGLRDSKKTLDSLGAAVIGVSPDETADLRHFEKKYNLNFPLIADTDGKIADAYGVRREPGKNIARRVSFLIGKDGKIAHVTDSPNADVHLAAIKDAVAKLTKKS